MSAQCVVSCLVTGYYHRYSEPYNELRYDAQYYGAAYYIGLAGLITTAISLASILGEESPSVDYMVSQLLKWTRLRQSFRSQSLKILIYTRLMDVSIDRCSNLSGEN